jgi:hypothetical protein
LGQRRVLHRLQGRHYVAGEELACSFRVRSAGKRSKLKETQQVADAEVRFPYSSNFSRTVAALPTIA